MIINKANIERWIFDYYEGNLTPHEQVELETFLARNPHYQEDFETWGESYDLPAEEPYFVPSYEHLKKQKTPLSSYVSVAALALLVLAGIFYLQNESDATYSPRIFVSHGGDNQVTESEDAEGASVSSTSRGVRTGMTVASISTIAANQISLNNLNPNNNLASVDMEVNSVNIISPSTIASDLEKVSTTEKTERYLKADRFDILKNRPHNENRMVNHSTEPQSKIRNFFEVLSERDVALTNYGDPIFIQSDADMLQINPALAGSQKNTRLSYNGRYQWGGSNQQLLVNRASLDGKITRKSAYSVQASSINFSNSAVSVEDVSAGYTRSFDLGREAKLAVGIKGSLAQISVNRQKLVGLSRLELTRGLAQDVPETQLNRQGAVFGGGAGAWLNTRYFYVGASISSLNTENVFRTSAISSGITNNKYICSVQMGSDYRKNAESKLMVSPSVVVNMMKGNSEIWMASILRYGAFVGGAGVSSQKAGRLTTGFDTGRFRMMYAADYTKSLVDDQFMMSHELNMRVLLGRIDKNESILQFD